jgi:D-tyrosyl-tRNA(Tyr) deacylase
MRAVVTRVSDASVTVGGAVIGRISKGLLVLVGIAPEDTPDTAVRLADKILGLRYLRMTKEK